MGFSRRGGGRVVEKRIIGDKGTGSGAITSITELHYAIREILGHCEPDVDTYKLNRTMPKAAATVPWLYADRISEIVGLGEMTKTASTSVVIAAKPFDDFALYPTYELTVEFVPVAFPHAENNEIGIGSLTWTKPDGSTASKSYAKEWLRYTTFERTPAAEWITAEAGQFQIDVFSGEDPDTFQASKGQVKMLIPSGSLKATWHEVPALYVDSVSVDSYIQQGLGHINQFSWRGFDAGTLLFTAVQVNRYQPAIPDFAVVDGSDVIGPNLLCDITFIFLIRDQPLGKDAAGNTATPAAAVNANAIQDGWNFVPLAHMNDWYYAKSTGFDSFSAANNRPLFPSFPFELLFTNPGV